jgi:carboxymethylenebutenolidase
MRVELSDGSAAELATPKGEAVRGVVLLPDIMGLRPLFDEHCVRLAAEYGWAVCAPEPFVGREDEPLEQRLARMGEFDGAGYLRRIEAAADHLGGLGVGPVGVVGFCMGGMFALVAAGTGRFDRAVSFYGMIHVPEAWRGPGLVDPLAAATVPGACPILAIVGTADAFTPRADVADLEVAGAEVVRYEGAEHGFVHDASRPTHRAADAADAWARVAAFLAV